MSNDNKLARSALAFNSVCEILKDGRALFTPHFNELKIECTVKADIPINMEITLNAEYEILLITSLLPFAVMKEVTIDTALAVNLVNSSLIDGSFDFDVYGGNIRFRMTSSYRDSVFSRSLFEYMMKYAVKIIDKYDNSLFCLSCGAYTLEQFVRKIGE